MDVAAGVADFTMSEIRLDEAEVGATLRQIVAARVAERVGVNVQMPEAAAFGCAVEHELYRARAERGAAFGGKDVIAGRVGVFAAHPSQGTDFDAAEPVVAV